MPLDTQPAEPKLAILMLCCRDYAAVELALACHMAYGDPDVPLFVLQNCAGDYDAERTYEAARRYAALYPGRIRVLDRRAPSLAYFSIRAALRSELDGYDLVCKVDDDCFPIAPGWVGAMRKAWAEARRVHGAKLAYVTPLINNNNWGFPETVRALGLEDELFRRFAPADRAAYGPTIWGSPEMARWLHERSTLAPDRFVEATRGLGPATIPSRELYSIGCALFRPELWYDCDDGTGQDEIMLWRHCHAHGLAIVCQRSVPFVHLAYYPQKEALRDVVRQAHAVYQARLGIGHPIAGRPSQLDEVESRLRFLEHRLGQRAQSVPADPAESAARAHEALVSDPDSRFVGRPSDELPLEEQAARESAAWGSVHLARAVPTRRPSETLKRALALAPRGGLALEFGVGSGATLRVVADGRGDGRVWGFDSFRGLPEAWRRGFPAGAFATPELPRVPGAELVVGLFDQTLPPFLVEHTEPVDFVHVDCDLYSSTRTVLELLEHRLRPGTVLSFDEYYNYPGWQEHEHRAWTEFVQRAGVKFSYELYTLGDEQVAVRLLG